jgi:hypothetical protein
MSKRFWLLGFVGLILVALLAACGSNYNSSTNGLVLVGSQGSSVIQTFSLNPGSGHIGSVANSTNDTSNQTCLFIRNLQLEQCVFERNPSRNCGIPGQIRRNDSASREPRARSESRSLGHGFSG